VEKRPEHRHFKCFAPTSMKTNLRRYLIGPFAMAAVIFCISSPSGAQ